MAHGYRNPVYSKDYDGGIDHPQNGTTISSEPLAKSAMPPSNAKRPNLLSRLLFGCTDDQEDITTKHTFCFWDDEEILEKEETEYYKCLVASKPSEAQLKSEIIATTVNNYLTRLKVLLRYIKDDLNIDLDHETVQGFSGESVICIAAIHGHSDMVEYLLNEGYQELLYCEMGPQTALAGSNFVHGCAINGSYEILELILNRIPENNKYQLIHSRAYGSFFYDAVKTHTGQPLCLALWCGHKDIYDLLVKHGAQLDIKDEKTGNTMFHSLVYQGQNNPELAIKTLEEILNEDASKEWYCRKMNVDRHKLKPHWMHNYLLKIENNDGYTPVTLAAMLGVQKMLSYLLQIEGVYKFTQNKFGPVSSMHYDMSEIDPAVAAEVRPGKPSILELLIYDNDDDDLPILSIQPVKGLMSIKWQTYRVLYIIWGIIHVCAMILFSISGLADKKSMKHGITRINGTLYVGKPGDMVQEDLNATWWESLKFKVENVDGFLKLLIIYSLIVLLGTCYLTLELVDVLKSLHLFVRSRIDSHRHYRAPISVIIKFDVFRVVNVSFALSIVSFYLTNMKGMPSSRNNLSIASVFGWYFCLFFTRAYKPLGFFTVMVHRILLGDLIRFAVVIFVIMIGFGVGMRVLFIDADPMIEDMQDASHTIQSMFRLMVGLSEYDFLYEASDPELAIVLFCLFVILTTILLLNMLIAAMSDTFATISGSKDALWRKQRVASVLLMERRTPAFFRRFLFKRFLKYNKERETYMMLVREVKK